jgi:hypothetical protein
MVLFSKELDAIEIRHKQIAAIIHDFIEFNIVPPDASYTTDFI